MELNRPSEALDVDHVNQHQRQPEADGQPDPLADRANQRRFDDHHPAHLPSIGAGQSQQRQLAPALEHEGEERAGHAEHRHGDRNQLQRVGDREGAVEDDQDLVAERLVAEDEGAMPFIQHVHHFAADLLGIGARFQVCGDAGRLQVAEILSKGAAVHHRHAAIARVVVVDRCDPKRLWALRRWDGDGVAVVLLVAAGERLGHDHRIPPDRATQFLTRVCGTLEQQAAVVEDHVVRPGAEHREVAFVHEIDVAKAIERLDLRMCRQRSNHILGHRLLGTDRRSNAGPDEEIGLQRLAHPVHDRVAEAADHHRDRHHHRQADRERRHRDGEPRNRRRQVRMGEQAFNAKPAPQQPAADAGESIHDRRDHEGAADHDRERRHVAEHRPPADRRQLRQPVRHRQHDQRRDERRGLEAHAHLERVVAAHRRGRLHAARFERGYRRRDQRQRQADGDRDPDVVDVHVRRRGHGRDI